VPPSALVGRREPDVLVTVGGGHGSYLPNVMDPAPPRSAFTVDDKVTHGKYGLGTVTGVEDGVAVLIGFGSLVQRILTPSAKLTKL
jgi:hypothetical protein